MNENKELLVKSIEIAYNYYSFAHHSSLFNKYLPY